MIATIETLERTEKRASPAMRRARRLVAETLLKHEPQERLPRIPAWQAWLLTGWMGLSTMAYFAALFGLLK